MTKKIDVHSLDYSMALILKPLLEQYKSETTAFPGVLHHYADPMAEWHSRLDRMILAFEHIIMLRGERPTDHNVVYTVFTGLKLFSEHFLDLWY